MRDSRPNDHPAAAPPLAPPRRYRGRLHALKGDRKEFLDLRLSARWRVVVRFEGADTYDVEVADCRRS